MECAIVSSCLIRAASYRDTSGSEHLLYTTKILRVHSTMNGVVQMEYMHRRIEVRSDTLHDDFERGMKLPSETPTNLLLLLDSEVYKKQFKALFIFTDIT